MPLDPAVYIELLHIYYNNALTGHFGEKKTLNLLLRKYYWLSITVDVINYIFTYNLCQCMRAP